MIACDGASSPTRKALQVGLDDLGFEEPWLGVDADNPSGALGLYERLGFEATYRSTAWRKPMENPSPVARDTHRPTSGAG